MINKELFGGSIEDCEGGKQEMEDAKILQMQQEIEQLKEMNQLLRDKNQRLEESVKFDEQHMDMAVKLKAIEYIIKTASYSAKTDVLASVLGIPMPKEDDD